MSSIQTELNAELSAAREVAAQRQADLDALSPGDPGYAAAVSALAAAESDVTESLAKFPKWGGPLNSVGRKNPA